MTPSRSEAGLLPSYLDQSDDVRERFDRIKARDVILKVERLGKTFRSAVGTTLALDDINFSTHRREFLCVVGPSGCGKSTLIRILAGLEEKSGGGHRPAADGRSVAAPDWTGHRPGTQPGNDRGLGSF